MSRKKAFPVRIGGDVITFDSMETAESFILAMTRHGVLSYNYDRCDDCEQYRNGKCAGVDTIRFGGWSYEQDCKALTMTAL